MEDTALKFNELWQDAIVGYMMADYAFFLRCKDFIKPSYFQDPLNKEIVAIAFGLHETRERKCGVTGAEITGALYAKHLNDIQTYNAYKAKIVKCGMAIKSVGFDILSNEMTAWIRLILLKQSMIEGEKLYNKAEYTNATMWLKSMMQRIEQTSFTQDGQVDFSDPVEIFKARQRMFENCCTTGNPDFDEMMLTGAKKKLPADADSAYCSDIKNLTTGGLIPGDTTIIIGPTNAGKTTVVITIVAANIHFGKDILYITCEQKADDICAKIYEAVSGMEGPQLSNLEKDAENLKRAEWVSAMANKHLTYVPWTKPGEMFVENVISMITRKQEEKIAKTGKGYDLLVVDYPAKLKAKQFTNKSSSVWDEQLYVYDQFVLTAEHYRFHGILPVQSNREGFKISKGDSNKFVGADNVANSFGITNVGANVITINRSEEAKKANMIYFYLEKSRFNKTGYTFGSQTRFQASRTHWFADPRQKHVMDVYMNPAEAAQATQKMLVGNQAASPDYRFAPPIASVPATTGYGNTQLVQEVKPPEKDNKAPGLAYTDEFESDESEFYTENDYESLS